MKAKSKRMILTIFEKINSIEAWNCLTELSMVIIEYLKGK